MKYYLSWKTSYVNITKFLIFFFLTYFEKNIFTRNLFYLSFFRLWSWHIGKSHFLEILAILVLYGCVSNLLDFFIAKSTCATKLVPLLDYYLTRSVELSHVLHCVFCWIAIKIDLNFVLGIGLADSPRFRRWVSISSTIWYMGIQIRYQAEEQR